MNNLDTKTAIVTGAYGSIGLAITKGLIENNYEVTMVGKNEYDLKAAVDKIIMLKPQAKIKYEIVDLSKKKSIEDLAQRWRGQLNVLINNAATAPKERLTTHENIELQFASNVLGYFWMMFYMHEYMKDIEYARIVNVASYWAGDLDMQDLMFVNRKYDNDTAYRQSKQANRMLTVIFAEKFKKFGITVNSCHPGDVNSKLSNHLGYGGSESPQKGAETPLWLACSDEAGNFSGKYFEGKKETHCRFSKNLKAIDELYRICSKF